jgi:putative multiple sugar transport system ATP-binding protein
MKTGVTPEAPETPKAPLLEMRGICKNFFGVAALSGVNLAVRAGEIHSIVGENGAGKSTLMKVLSGVYEAGSYEGDIVFEGQVRRFAGIRDSEALGIIIIHQELALVPLLSIAENIFLGHEISKHGVVDHHAAQVRAAELLARVGLHENPATPVGELGVGKQQLIEIAKALARDVRLLILDEPTASLNESDSQRLLALLLELKRQGISCILISHKLNEIAFVADRITVLRDGATVETMEAAGVSENRIISAMVGREMADRYPKRTPAPGAVMFEIRDWWAYHPQQAERAAVQGVNLVARRGEIVGIAGLMGAGRTELAMSVFGKSWGTRIRGQVLIDGQAVELPNVRRAIAAGLAYVTEDRKGLGILAEQSITHNTTLARLQGVSRGGVIDDLRERAVAEGWRKDLATRCSSVDQPIVHLSGGNQQKVMLARWLFAQPRVLILDEPTRGIDVGAKFEIYSLIAKLAAEGLCIVVISSELPELLGLTERLYVMNEGRFVAEMPTREATQEAVMGAILRDGQTRSRAA